MRIRHEKINVFQELQDVRREKREIDRDMLSVTAANTYIPHGPAYSRLIFGDTFPLVFALTLVYKPCLSLLFDIVLSKMKTTTTTALLGLLATLAAASPQGRPGYGPPGYGPPSRPGTGTGRPGFPGRPGGGPPQPPTTPIPGDDDEFEPLHHLGANSPWFPGPNMFGIDPAAPDGCVVDQAVYIARHGSRYPDPGAYNGWVSLYEKVSEQILFKQK